jgi:hypothetical protein
VTSTQISLFDLLPAAAPQPVAVDPLPAIKPVVTATGVHWVLVTTTKARTACISMPAYYDKLKCGYSDKGQRLSCTHNRDDGTVTCERCLEEMR